MFESLFGTKNSRLAKKWTKEHEKMVVYAHKILAAYSINDNEAIRKNLLDLRIVAINHIMTEDIEFYKLLQDKKRLNESIEQSVHQFTDSFHDTKVVIRDFLRKYTEESAVYDENFFTTFNGIVDALGARIEYEEKNLYKLLRDK